MPTITVSYPTGKVDLKTAYCSELREMIEAQKSRLGELVKIVETVDMTLPHNRPIVRRFLAENGIKITGDFTVSFGVCMQVRADNAEVSIGYDKWCNFSEQGVCFAARHRMARGHVKSITESIARLEKLQACREVDFFIRFVERKTTRDTIHLSIFKELFDTFIDSHSVR